MRFELTETGLRVCGGVIVVPYADVRRSLPHPGECCYMTKASRAGIARPDTTHCQYRCGRATPILTGQAVDRRDGVVYQYGLSRRPWWLARSPWHGEPHICVCVTRLARVSSGGAHGRALFRPPGLPSQASIGSCRRLSGRGGDRTRQCCRNDQPWPVQVLLVRLAGSLCTHLRRIRRRGRGSRCGCQDRRIDGHCRRCGAQAGQKDPEVHQALKDWAHCAQLPGGPAWG